MFKKVLIPLITGNEEIETVTIYSILSRAGNKVLLSKCPEINKADNNLNVKLSRGLTIRANRELSYNMKNKFDLIILPGGLLGAKNYNKCEMIKRILYYRKKENLLYGAICATPGVFLAKNNLLNYSATCFPSFKNNLTEHGYKYENKPIVQDGNIITGRGAGDAITFSLKLVKILNGKNIYNNVKKSLLL